MMCYYLNVHFQGQRVKVVSAYSSTAIEPQNLALLTSSDPKPIAVNFQLLHFTTLTSKLASTL